MRKFPKRTLCRIDTNDNGKLILVFACCIEPTVSLVVPRLCVRVWQEKSTVGAAPLFRRLFTGPCGRGGWQGEGKGGEK